MHKKSPSPDKRFDYASLVSTIHWYHSIDLGNGIVTDGDFDLRGIVNQSGLPGDMNRLIALDVGSSSGFWAFEMEKRGEEAPNYIKELRLKYENYRKQARPFLEKYNFTGPGQIREAAIRFVLDNANMNSVLVTYKNFDDVHKYLRLSGSRFTDADEGILHAYAESYVLSCRKFFIH